MNIRVVSTGLDSLIRDMAGFMEDLNDNISEVITNDSAKVIREARQNHRYKADTGNLERATKSGYKRKRNSHLVEFYIEDSMVSPDHRSYGVFIHEGTYQGYSRSPIAPAYSNSISKSGQGWKADPFLWNAIEKLWKPEESLKKVSEKMRRKYQRV